MDSKLVAPHSNPIVLARTTWRLSFPLGCLDKYTPTTNRLVRPSCTPRPVYRLTFRHAIPRSFSVPVVPVIVWITSKSGKPWEDKYGMRDKPGWVCTRHFILRHIFLLLLLVVFAAIQVHRVFIHSPHLHSWFTSRPIHLQVDLVIRTAMLPTSFKSLLSDE